jgi:predicted nucleic acid-binding protein
MHFLGDAGGWGYQRALWHMSGAQILTIRDLSADDVRRMPELMDRYQNVPVDLADASLVAFAEAMKLHRIFTLDSDFRIYRTAAGAAFEIVP